MADKIKLNIGAGGSNLPGFIPLDIQTGTDATKRLPYADESVDEVYASHVLEHIHHSKTLETLKEWVRVLKPGGRIRVAVPNFDRVLGERGSLGPGMVSAWLHGSHDVDTDRHLAVFNWEQLDMMFRSLGIDHIGEWKAEYNDCSQLPMSMNIQGYKRMVRINPSPKVALVLSTARFGPIDLYGGVVELCRLKGWKFYQWGGDNWQKALTQLIEQAMAAEDLDYIITLDFDSCFDAAETAKMVDWMQEHPEVAAAWPVQAHRHQDLPLGYSPQAGAVNHYDFSKTNPWKGEFTSFGSGHFGCTVIRTQVFKTMPKPWLCGLPNPETGDWDRGALDNDISFWVSMQAHGFIFGQLNTVQIGHMEWCCKWVVGDKIAWQPIQHYRRHGRPKDAMFDGEAWNAKMRKQFGVPDPAPPTAVAGPDVLAVDKVVEVNGLIKDNYYPDLPEQHARAVANAVAKP